jgi:hypothetical protein
MRSAPGPVDREQVTSATTFRALVASLEEGVAEQRQARRELSFDSDPPPRKLAPFAAAVSAIVVDAGDLEVGWGRFILLYDPAGQTGWDGPLRIIAYIRADLEPEIAADSLIGQVGWTWLTEALDARTGGYTQTSGTVTRVVTEGFGGKQDEPVATEFELRASWSPLGILAVGTGLGSTGTGTSSETSHDEMNTGEMGTGLDGHVAAWCDALCTASGLPPSAGVSALRPQRRRRPR